jgi:hypothetical protein
MKIESFQAIVTLCHCAIFVFRYGESSAIAEELIVEIL